jgi:transposase-like protein
MAVQAPEKIGREYDPKVKAKAIKMYAKVGARRASRELGISERTIIRWGRKAGLKSGYEAPESRHGGERRWYSGCDCKKCQGWRKKKSAQVAARRAAAKAAS